MYSRGKTIARLIHGLSQLSSQNTTGDILITAVRSEAYSSEEFTKKLMLFRQRILRKLFTKGASVVTRSDAGRLHCHLAVEMPCSSTEFDWTSFDQSENYYRLYKKYSLPEYLKFYRYFTKKYRRSLPLQWQELNHKLMAAGKKYGFGRVFMTPIRKNMKAYQWYLVSNIPYKRQTRDKGLHFYYSWGMTITGTLQVVNKFTRAYRARVKKFAEGLQLTSENYTISLRSVLGRRWYHKVEDLIKGINDLSIEQVREYNELKSSVRTHLIRSNE